MQMYRAVFSAKNAILIFLATLGVGACQNINELKYNPAISPNDWCQNQPCWEYNDITISQPSSSIIVYLLAAFTLWAGYRFYKTKADQKSRYWWAITLFLGGLGAASAGTSFQAFGYMIKCAGQDSCMLSSWWEVVYNILTVAGAGTLLIAISYSSMSTIGQKWSKYYAVVSTLAYTIACLVGAVLPNAFLVSFDFMIMATIPAYIVIVGLHIVQYFKTKEHLVLTFLGCWGLFALTFIAYTFYDAMGYTQELWKKGIWFSENDVLHVMMLIWCAYVYIVLVKSVKDRRTV
ncbi:MAG: hypothetical protein GY810_03450 [Aureispira sp.]|nr:hypothetical protein [Aureispira sp.]